MYWYEIASVSVPDRLSIPFLPAPSPDAATTHTLLWCPNIFFGISPPFNYHTKRLVMRSCYHLTSIGEDYSCGHGSCVALEYSIRCGDCNDRLRYVAHLAGVDTAGSDLYFIATRSDIDLFIYLPPILFTVFILQRCNVGQEIRDWNSPVTSIQIEHMNKSALLL